ncbi:E3 ubiquitin-protein ligase NEURL3 [Hyperolius riggenbachi]|uniref:E3 ubiquitin-protein ligase NEURL3 n=1 Tax=Hyperolius riggenbachi TaxID=752182 RepID=UPI0035A31DFF
MTVLTMGSYCSSAGEEGISFHSHCKGSNISLNSCHHQARRGSSFHDGLVFSNRPLLPREKVRIRILEEEMQWFGALRVGFTSVNPNTISHDPLPPFACPDLTDNPGFWAIGIPEELCKTGDELCFWINRKGQALCKVEGRSRPTVLFSGIPKKTPMWVMLDIYGRTKAIQVVNHKSRLRESPCACHQNNKEHQEISTSHVSLSSLDKMSAYTTTQSPHESVDLRPEAVHLPYYQEDDPFCVICQDRLSDTLLLPCRHCCFCEPCAVMVKRQGSRCPLCRQTFSSMHYVGALHQSNSWAS